MVGQKASFDNSATVKVLGWDPTPIETSRAGHGCGDLGT